MCVGLYAEKKNMVTRKNKLVEWKALDDTVGTKSVDLKDKFLFYSFAAFQTAWM